MTAMPSSRPSWGEELIRSFGQRVLRTPAHAPKANAFCERLVGTARRECLDFMILLNEGHLRMTLRSWVTHYNRGRPHSSLGPSIPEMVMDNPLPRSRMPGHRLPRDCEIKRKTSWAVCITNTGWNSASREPSQVSAEDSGIESPFYNTCRTLGIIAGDSACASPRKYGMSRISVRRVQK